MLRNAMTMGVVLSTVVVALAGTQGTAAASTPRVAATAMSAVAAAAAPDPRLAKLVAEARHQTTLGISYLYAGGHGVHPAPLNSHVDCSGLVRELYNYAFGVDIGGGSGDGMIRTSGKFTRTNSPVPGDVVLLGNGGSAPAYHTGIYIGIVNGERAMVGSPQTGQNIKVQQSRGGSWGGDLMGFWHYKGATAVAAVVKPTLPSLRGHFDAVSAAPNTFTVTGWALDPQRASRGAMAEVLMDGRRIAVLRTTTVRADINSAQRVSGAHGFRGTVGAAPGRHTICINARPDGSNSRAVSLGCRAVGIPATPSRGVVERTVGGKASFAIWGWAYSPRTPTLSNVVRITLDGHPLTNVRAGLARADVNRLQHITGAHGFAVRLAAKPGRHTVCSTSMPATSASSPTYIGCRLITVS